MIHTNTVTGHEQKNTSLGHTRSCHRLYSEHFTAAQREPFFSTPTTMPRQCEFEL